MWNVRLNEWQAGIKITERNINNLRYADDTILVAENEEELKSLTHGFSSSHVWMWDTDHKEGWALKNWCFWIMVLEKTLESLLDSKAIKAVNQ